VGSILLITAYVDTNFHLTLEAIDVALWAIPTGICALLLHGIRMLMVDRRIDRLVRLDRLKFSLTTGGLVCAKPATVATEGKVLLTIPTNSATDYSLAVAANWVATGVAVDINGTTSTAWPALSATAASNVTGKVVTWTAGDLTVGTVILLYVWRDPPDERQQQYREFAGFRGNPDRRRRLDRQGVLLARSGRCSS